jgi:transposase InsO family protein
MAGHCGRHKTAARLQERYYWRGMRADVNKFVLSCVVCQRNRAVKRAPWGAARIIGTPDFCWQHIHMDWTVGFPPSRLQDGKPSNAILTFIDRLSGYAHFVAARAEDKAEDTAVHFVIRHHGCPDRIIADNDVRLRAGFWDALTKRLGIEMNHTSAYHPRANGKVENSHSTLYDILRSMVSRWGKNWAEHLPMAEFAFNSSVSASTGFSPFQVAHGHSPPFPGELRGERSSVPRAEAAATRTIALTTACRDAFEDSQMDNQEQVSLGERTSL